MLVAVEVGSVVAVGGALVGVSGGATTARVFDRLRRRRCSADVVKSPPHPAKATMLHDYP